MDSIGIYDDAPREPVEDKTISTIFIIQRTERQTKVYKLFSRWLIVQEPTIGYGIGRNSLNPDGEIDYGCIVQYDWIVDSRGLLPELCSLID